MARPPRWAVAGLLGLVGALGAGCGGGGDAADAESPAGAPSAVQTYGRPFVAANGTTQIHFTRPGTDRTNGEDPEADDEIVQAIDQARSSLDMSLFEFSRQNVIEAVVRAHRRGVAVRLAGDGDELSDEGYQALQAAGVELVLRRPGDRIMHNKFAIIDGKRLLTGSMNWSENGVMLNNNNLLLLDNLELAVAYDDEFQQMYNQRLFGKKKVSHQTGIVSLGGGQTAEVFFSPTDATIQGLRALISGAQQRVLFMIFSFTHLDVAQDLMDLKAAGKEVVGVFDTSQARGRYSVDETLARAGVPVFLDGNGNSRGFAGGKLHHKVMIIDPGTVNAAVVSGSFNWSKNAASFNDENLIILRGKELVQPFVEEFIKVLGVAKTHPDYTGPFPDVASQLLQQVRINEILANPSGVDGPNEFVEIMNVGGGPVNLTGWTLGDRTVAARHTFAAGTKLAAGERLLIYSGASASHPQGAIAASGGALGLGNTRDGVQLRDDQGTLVDRVAYRSARSGVSFNRKPDGAGKGPFVLHTALGPFKTSPGSAATDLVIINEILANPTGADAGGEYVEIVNAGQAPVDLSGWQLGDAAMLARHVFAQGTVLLPGEVLVVFDRGDHARVPHAVLASTGKLSLNNSSETVRLANRAGVVLDQVRYRGAKDGVSFNRSPDRQPGAPLALHTLVNGQPSSPGLPAGALVRINEVLADAGHGFCEIVNLGQASVDITGWTIGDLALRTRHVFDVLILGPGERATVFEPGLRRETARAPSASSGTLGLDQTGDTIFLRDPLGELIDKVTIGAAATAGVSFNRNPDGGVAGPFVAHRTLGTHDSSPGRPAGAAVRINEVLANPVGTDAGKEYIEIVNAGGSEADIAGWTLGDRTSAARHVFAAPAGQTALVLAPGERLVVFDKGTHPSPIVRWLNASSGSLSLTNSTDSVRLFDSGGVEIDSMRYRQAASGVALVRAVDGADAGPFVPHDTISSAVASPGRPATGRVILNEVLANPASSPTANEFCELVNVGQEPVDLTGWTLADGVKVRHAFSGTLQPGDTVVVFGGAGHTAAPNAVVASSGGLSLNNGGDSIVVRSARGKIVDAWVYTSGDLGSSGASVGRAPDRQEDAPFAVQASATPGQ